MSSNIKIFFGHKIFLNKIFIYNHIWRAFVEFFYFSYYSITLIESKLDRDQTDIFKLVSHQMIVTDYLIFIPCVF